MGVPHINTVVVFTAGNGRIPPQNKVNGTFTKKI